MAGAAPSSTAAAVGSGTMVRVGTVVGSVASDDAKLSDGPLLLCEAEATFSVNVAPFVCTAVAALFRTLLSSVGVRVCARTPAVPPQRHAARAATSHPVKRGDLINLSPPDSAVGREFADRI